MFCAAGLIFGIIEGVRSRFHVLPSQTRFGGTKGVGPLLMFLAPQLIFGGTVGVRSRFHVYRSRNRFRQYRGIRVQFSCFALPNSLFTIPRASGPFFIFCAFGLIFNSTVGVGSRFHVLYSQTRFRRYRGRRVPFECPSLSDSFWAVPRASGPVFLILRSRTRYHLYRAPCPVSMFCAPGLVFNDTKGVGSRFQVFSSMTHFGR
jgi:hypothetical protein